MKRVRLIDRPKGGKKGRPKGKIRRLTDQAIKEAEASGELPLAYMLRVMRDHRASTDRRDMFAMAAAPYLHARLARIQHADANDKPLFKSLIIEFGGPEDENIEQPVMLDQDKHGNVVPMKRIGAR